ncbi:MAG TPA: tyrosine-type recombinase/integrase [Mucilaginibacter sp.]|jgi:site-specific recombinase XerD|nr:tyrosine-type recombinase/integrase [Mucilaginibacter sp.]
MKISIKPILWTYKEIKANERDLIAGEYAVLVRMTQNRAHTLMATGFSSSKEDWDTEKAYPKLSHPKFKELAIHIDKLIEDIDFEIKLAEKDGRLVTAIEIKNRLSQSFKLASSSSDRPNKIMAYMQMVINKYEAANNPGYANVFHNCRLTVKKLLKDKDKLFLAFTKDDHEAYEEQISRNTSESTKSNYLRTYYRIWNMAILDGLVTKNHHPKQFIKFKAYKRIRTKKRSIKSDYWKRIQKLKFPPNTRMYRSYLLMQFMYYARGMNFNDMLKLKWTDFKNNGIVYTRSKNKRSYDFELHSNAVKVIKLFMDYPEQSDSGHIFPFLMQEHDTARKIDTRIDSALKDFNEDISAMAQAVGWEKSFTSNALRHGFASHLNEANVDIKIIQEAMGHETQLQTRTYLDDIDDSIITEAINKALP